MAREFCMEYNEAAAKDLELDIFIEAYDYARPMMWFENHTDVMEHLNPVLEQIFQLGKATPAEVIPEVCQKITDMNMGV